MPETITSTTNTALYVHGDSMRAPIVAADILGGHLRFHAPENMRTTEANALFVDCLGHTAVQAATILRVTPNAYKNQLKSARGQLPEEVTTPSQVIDHCFDKGILETRQPSGLHYKPMTDRQREVWRLLARGHTMNDCSDLLNVTPDTVRTHRLRVFAALGLNTLTAIRLAYNMHQEHSPTIMRHYQGDKTEPSASGYRLHFRGGELLFVDDPSSPLHPIEANAFAQRCLGIKTQDMTVSANHPPFPGHASFAQAVRQVHHLYHSPSAITCLQQAIGKGHVARLRSTTGRRPELTMSETRVIEQIVDSGASTDADRIRAIDTRNQLKKIKQALGTTSVTETALWWLINRTAPKFDEAEFSNMQLLRIDIE